MKHDTPVYVAGHTGMIGSALVRELTRRGYTNIITRTRGQLDLLDQRAVADFFADCRPAAVFFAAGKTGGIYANNTYRADFLYENIVMQSNVIHQSFLHEVEKLLFYACSCIYPRQCPQPMDEEYILSGHLEPTNEPFAVAKIAGLKMCEAYNRQYGTDFITLIPTNVYGPGQLYEPLNSMVVPSLIERFHAAVQNGEPRVTIWGTGRPMRDFLYVDDLAECSVFLMENYEGNLLLNVGTGTTRTIAELAEIIREVTGYTGEIVYDRSRPDGVGIKLQDIAKISDLGWQAKTPLAEGIRRTFKAFLTRRNNP